MKNKEKNILNRLAAGAPLLLLGSPALTAGPSPLSSRFSLSNLRSRQVYIQQRDNSPPRQQKSGVAFASFSNKNITNTKQYNSVENSAVLQFLSDNNLLSSTTTQQSLLSGDLEARKTFFAGCTVGGHTQFSCTSYGGTWDATAPTLSAVGSSAITATTATVAATSNEAGTMYYVITTSASAPTNTQVRAGQGNTGAAAFKSGSSAVSANVAKSFAVSGLAGGTQYYFYITAKDNYTNYGSVSSGTFTTTAAAATITSATYDASTNSLVVTGTNMTIGDTIVVGNLTLSGEGGNTYTLTSSNVTASSATAFSITLNSVDQTNVEGLLNKNGTTSDGGTTYNLAAASSWDSTASSAPADTTGNGITVSNYSAPTITSATYGFSTGVLVVTGSNFVSSSGAANDVDISLLTFTGEAGQTYQLTSKSDVEVTSATEFTVTLSGTDKLAVDGLLNKNGTSSDDVTTYNLAAADNWMAGAAGTVDIADTSGNGITVSNYTAPTITSASYKYATGILTVTGANFVSSSGATNDVDISLLTFTGEAGQTNQLTSKSDVEVTSATEFTVTLSGTDKLAVEGLLNKDGTSSDDVTTYNLAAADNWMAGAAGTVDIADTSGNGITVSNYTAPTITSASYKYATGALTVTGANFVSSSGATNDVDISLLSFTGEAGQTYQLTSKSDVEVTSATEFTVTLSGTDKLAVEGLLNKDGTLSDDVTTYNLAAADNWMAGAAGTVDIADATGNGITVSNYTVPTITSASYKYATGILTVTGTHFVSSLGATNDVDISLLTFTGEAGQTYQLTSKSDVEVTSATAFTVTLSGADKLAVDGLLNKDGTSSDDASTYNLAADDNWMAGAASTVDIADATNAVTVSSYAAPTVTSATYDWSTGQLVISGSDFVNKSGATNDVSAALLTFTGEGGSYTLTDTSDVEITSATSATLTISTTDKLNIHGLLNKNGTVSSSANTYNLAAADNWMTASPPTTDIADLTGNGITVSNLATPTITSATYDSSTGIVTVTGSNFFKKIGSNNDIDISKFTFTGGSGNATYTLTSTSDIEITSSTSFSFTLTGADKTNVDALLDQLGGSSSGGSTYNISADEDWLAGADAAANIADTAGNAITVSVNPAITSATYSASTGSLVVTGSNYQANGGGTDIDASLFTLTGEGGSTYTLTDTADVEIDSVSQFTLILSATDKAALNQIMNKNGTSSTGASTYNIAAADDWNTNVTAGDTADATGNAVTVSNVPVPAITSATYNASTGALVVTGTNLLKLSGSTNDIDSSMFTFTGEGGDTYTLITTADVEITDATTFTVSLSTVDMTAVNMILNKNGTASTVGTTYNLAAADNWAAGADTSVNVADTAGNGITVSNVAVPIITSATYSSYTSELLVTGTGFLKASGAANDIDISKFTITGQGGGTYTISSASDVELDSATQFTIALSGADLSAINALINKDGSSAVDATTYNLAAAEDWANGADTAVNVADATGNGITATVNDTPVLTNLNGDTVSYSIGGNAVVLDNTSDATIADADSANFDGGNLTFSISANRVDSEDQLLVGAIGNITTSGTDVLHNSTIIGTYAGGTGTNNLVISFNTSATPSLVQDLIRAIQYSNTNNTTVSTSARTIQLTVNDGDGGNATSSTQTITVNLVRAPIIDLDADDSSGASNGGFNAGFSEDGGAVALADSDSSITDDGTFKSLAVTLTNSPDGSAESLSSSYGTGVQTVNGEVVTISAYNSGTGVLSISVDDTSTDAATIQMLMESILYNNSSDNPDTTNRSVTFTSTDNADNAGPMVTAFVSVARVNDAPIVNHSGNITVTEDTASAVTGISVSDVDAGSSNLTLNFSVDSGTLSATSSGGIVVGGSSAAMTLTGSATDLASFITANNVSFTTAANNTSTVTLSISANDNGNTGSGGAKTSATTMLSLLVTGVNDAPTNTTIPVVSGTAAVGGVLTASSGNWSDVDGDTLSYSYQWKADGVDISGATNSSYTVNNTVAHKTLTVVVTASDGNGGSVPALSAGTVLTNTAPVNSVLPVISGTASVGSTLSVSTGTWVDVDSDARSYTYQWQADGVAISGATGSSYTITSAVAHKTITVIVTSSDGNGGSTSATSAGNSISNVAPTFTATPALSGNAAVGSTLSIINTTTNDADGDTVSLSYVWKANGVVISGATASSYTLTSAEVQKAITAVVTASDGQGGSVSATTAAVSLSNTVPTISSTAITSVNEDSSYSYIFAVTDADNDIITLSAPTKPSWLTFNATTGLLSGKPGNAQVGDYSIVLLATDGVNSVEQAFNLTVVNVNDPPLIVYPPITAIHVGENYSLLFKAQDIDANTQLTYSAPILPGWLSFNVTTGRLSGVPAASDIGVNDVTLRVNDGVVDVDQIFNITVKPANVFNPNLIDTDKDGIADKDEAIGDSDGDGIPDWKESNIHDTDGDGILDYLDTDSDADGIKDGNEGDLDSDADGIPDRLESNILDTDNDGLKDYLDIDSDGDEIEDGVEGMEDSDDDGIFDRLESNILDTDHDGLLDYLDTDSDNDGKLDSDEGNTDTDADGILDRMESAIIDADGDGLSNEEDRDSDNDGIDDGVEGNADSDEDGLPDRLESNVLDSDGDGVNNYLDTDSDNDGISDGIEGYKDTDGDSIPDLLEANFTDTDNDGLYDYHDTDSDGDGIPDIVERTLDTDNDGLIDALDTDSDNDGISDAIEGYIDSDGDGLPDYRDTDSDGDDKDDSVEGNTDTDGDTYPDRVESSILDSDNDGIPDELDDDSDGDGVKDGTLSHTITTGDVTTRASSEVVGTRVHSSIDSNGDKLLITSVTAVNQSRQPVSVQINGYTDGHSEHRLQLTSNGKTYDVSASFAAAGASTIISSDLTITSKQSVNGVDITVVASSDGHARYQMLSTVNGISKTTSAQVAIPGTVTAVDTSGKIVTSLDQSSETQPVKYIITALTDGSATLSVIPLIDKGNGLEEGTASISTSNIAGADTTLDKQGVVTTTATDTLADGRSIEIKVKTLPNGESETWFIVIDGQKRETQFTSNQATPFESGNQSRLSEDKGKHSIAIETKVTRPIIF